MSSMEPENFELELRNLKPATPPEQFLDRLTAALPNQHNTRPQRAFARPFIQRCALFLRWTLAPAAISVSILLALLFWKPGSTVSTPGRPNLPSPVNPVLTADKVEIDRQLVAAFDTVAELPDGKPVRFRCREWVDQVLLQDSAKGLVVEQKIPRMEVEPIRFETY
jgi:hypothetical protein